MTLFRATAGALALALASGAAIAHEPAAPPADPGCVADLDARIKAIRADARLTPDQRQERVNAAWNACAPHVSNALIGAVHLSVDAAVSAAAHVDPLAPEVDPDAANRRARAAMAGIDGGDPEQRITHALVGAHVAEHEGDDR